MQCYRLVTVKNLRWRRDIIMTPIYEVEGIFPGSRYVLFVPMAFVSVLLAIALLFVALPLEAVVGIFDLGVRCGWSRFVALAGPTYNQVMEWKSSYDEWAKPMVQESIVLLVICIMGYILGAAAFFVAMLALFMFGLLTMMWWLVVAFTLPLFYAV